MYLYIFYFVILYNETTSAQLIDKLLYCCYMFRHHSVIFRELVVSTLLSYTNMSTQSLALQFEISNKQTKIFL